MSMIGLGSLTSTPSAAQNGNPAVVSPASAGTPSAAAAPVAVSPAQASAALVEYASDTKILDDYIIRVSYVCIDTFVYNAARCIFV